MKEISDETFKAEVLDAPGIVIVDFFAPWCGPCRLLSPILEDIELENEGKLRVVKVNSDQQTQSPSTYGVKGLPTVIIFKAGKPVETIVGFRSSAEFRKRIQGALN